MSIIVALHALAAVALIGPVMVSASMFPAQIATAATDTKALGSLNLLARITNTYGMISALVPVLGVAVFLSDLKTYSTQGQFHASIALAIIAWAILLFVIAPKQKAVVSAVASGATANGTANVDLERSRKQLAMFGGIFNLLWLVTAVLMFI